MSPVKHSTSGSDLRNLTLGSQRSSSRNENFMALLQKKGSKSSSGGARVSAMELLKSTNPLARRVTEFSTTSSTGGEGGDAASGNGKPNDQWSIVNGLCPGPFAVDKATNKFYNVPPTADGAFWLTCPSGSLQLLVPFCTVQSNWSSFLDKMVPPMVEAPLFPDKPVPLGKREICGEQSLFNCQWKVEV